MRSNTIPTIFAALLATACAAPVDTSSNPTNVLAARQTTNDCGTSDFVNDTTGGSPLVSDCLQLAANIAGAGTWTLAAWETQTLATYGTCSFQATNQAVMLVNVGNQDIIDLINSAVQQFQWSDGTNNLIGAEGTMECQGVASGNIDVWWGLYYCSNPSGCNSGDSGDQSTGRGR